MTGYCRDDSLCLKCANYYWGDHECRKEMYIADKEIIVECEYYDEGEPKRDIFEEE